MKKTKKLKNYKIVTLKHKDKLIHNNTPVPVQKIGKDINRILFDLKVDKNKKPFSYSPTINEKLITIKSIPREPINDCNNKLAFQLKEPLKIGIPGKIFDKTCYLYNTNEAKKFLLKNLSANKHIEPQIVITPIQSQSNCWFNTMFVSFFISDKGRKFFHFFRQLMIEGKQKNGQIIPNNLKDAFALLNFGIESCLTGNKYAYELDTNSIIHQIFSSIPKTYKIQFPLIVDVDEPGNPVIYYISIINYLNNNDIQTLFLRNCDLTWKKILSKTISLMRHLPHIIIMEIFDNTAPLFNKKPLVFTINQAKYKLDSAIVRDTTQQHFCATITCEKKEYGYDGMSFSRLSRLEWKNKLNNSSFNWIFEGTTNYDGTPVEWNFTKCYQLLFFYRIE